MELNRHDAARGLALVILLLSPPAVAEATLAYDAVSTAISDGSSNDLEWTHTPVGTPTGIACFVGIETTTDNIGGTTYGGQSMTREARVTEAGVAKALSVYTLYASIPAGAQTVSVDRTSADQVIAGCVSLTGTAPLSTEDVDTGSSAGTETPSVTHTTAATTLPVGGIYLSDFGVSAIAPGASYTERAETSGSEPSVLELETRTSPVAAGSPVVDWSLTGTNSTTWIGIAVKETAAGGACGRLLLLGVGGPC